MGVTWRIIEVQPDLVPQNLAWVESGAVATVVCRASHRFDSDQSNWRSHLYSCLMQRLVASINVAFLQWRVNKACTQKSQTVFQHFFVIMWWFNHMFRLTTGLDPDTATSRRAIAQNHRNEKIVTPHRIWLNILIISSEITQKVLAALLACSC
jgi:hypothetical protein